MDSVQSAIRAMAGLGDAAEIARRAGSARLRVNSHVHLPPNFSAFDSPAHALDLCDRQDVRVLGVSNYYDYTVYGPFAEQARRRGVFPLFGLEIICLEEELMRKGVRINDPGNPGKMYLCGKGIVGLSPMNEEARAILATIRANDSRRMGAMVERMGRVLRERGLARPPTQEGVIAMVVRRHAVPRDTVYLQERHVCMAFQEAIFAQVGPEGRAAALERMLGSPARNPLDPVAVQNDLRTALMKSGRPAYVDETFIGFAEAYRLVLALGGVPCYPVLADGASPVCGFEADVDGLVRSLRERGVFMAELIPIRNSPAALRRYVMALRGAGLPVLAGTEHNTLDLLAMEPACVGGVEIDDDLKAVFWEGACVAAAHQFLAAQGRTGYVDAEGRPSGDFGDDGSRIEAMARLGAAVIDAYRKQSERA